MNQLHMDQQALKFSIKNRLSHNTYSPNCSSFLTPAQPTSKIFNPSYYNYFLHSINKEIKHEGTLLRRIKRKIEDFKDQQKEKKRVKNSTHCHSHLMFNTMPMRKPHQAHHRRSKQSLCIPQTANGSRKNMSSAFASTRDTSKVRISSLATQQFKTAHQKSQSQQFLADNWRQSNMISTYREDGLLQKQNKQVQINKGLAVMGGRPQWRNFQSYRNNSTYMLKKRS